MSRSVFIAGTDIGVGNAFVRCMLRPASRRPGLRRSMKLAPIGWVSHAERIGQR